MISKAFPQAFIVLVSLLLILKSAVCKEVVNVEFNVIPGGSTETHTETFNGMSCLFTYSCQGGTLEKWEMSINEEKDQTHVCRVSRPDHSPTSYLFFEKFVLTIDGASLLGAFVMGEDGKQCGEDEYSVDTRNSQVKSQPGFKSHLNKVFAVFKEGKQEL